MHFMSLEPMTGLWVMACAPKGLPQMSFQAAAKSQPPCGQARVAHKKAKQERRGSNEIAVLGLHQRAVLQASGMLVGCQQVGQGLHGLAGLHLHLPGNQQRSCRFTLHTHHCEGSRQACLRYKDFMTPPKPYTSLQGPLMVHHGQRGPVLSGAP